MTNDISIKQRQIDFWEVFLIICLDYTVITMLAIFLEEDLFRILSPFFAPFFLLFIALGYLVLVAASILYIPFQIRNLAWRVLIPIAINSMTFLIVYNFYDSLEKLRVDIGFQVNEKRFNQAVNWVTQSIQNGDLDLNDRSDTVILPKEYKNLADDGRVWVTNKYGVISIFFSRGGGMFEYYPGYRYRSDNAYPPIEDGDIVCMRRIRMNWYDCY
jgi:hypothetical protein